ncbi:Hypothetical protein NTJ_06099 [Nesidiocoris tenuis]|uniref:Uncharacterized protein n=1 Tax=Nesidiocoris tenuis TaxID=355587 RepID=A0ABN7AM36_9HEMI|nr:Hypothetical protein NTJ_06099 [Nesidiocoris tenuis]
MKIFRRGLAPPPPLLPPPHPPLHPPPPLLLFSCSSACGDAKGCGAALAHYHDPTEQRTGSRDFRDVPRGRIPGARGVCLFLFRKDKIRTWGADPTEDSPRTEMGSLWTIRDSL